ncbi:MAG: hypothetical protein LBJ67_05835 [Planctomycetaceae bacterium]|jgi:hypothetical protein|nr:hypothetical protein [Planctomycetaceae bacterium]
MTCDFHETDNPYTYYDDSQRQVSPPFDDTFEDEELERLKEKILRSNKRIFKFVGYAMFFPLAFTTGWTLLIWLTSPIVGAFVLGVFLLLVTSAVTIGIFAQSRYFLYFGAIFSFQPARFFIVRVYTASVAKNEPSVAPIYTLLLTALLAASVCYIVLFINACFQIHRNNNQLLEISQINDQTPYNLNRK